MKPSSPQLSCLLARLGRLTADGLFALLLLALVIASGWLVARHDRLWDWSAASNNSLTRESLTILGRLQGQLRISVFAAADSQIGKSIGRLLTGYVQARPDLAIDYLDPQLFPERARNADVSLVGQILVQYQGRRETLKTVSERDITAAIARLTEIRPPWVAILEGHDEPAIEGQDVGGFGRFGAELKSQGYLVRPLDLASSGTIPDNTRLLILTMPRIPLFPREVQALSAYLDRGGNLLWLMDPGAKLGLEPLVARLGLSILPGVVVDAAAARWGVETPAVAVIEHYPEDVFSAGLTDPILLPGCLGFDTRLAPGWTLVSYLATGDQSWNETGRLSGKIDRDDVVGEQPGPIPVVLALTRTLPDSSQEQRVAIVGDSDFLTHAQFGSQGNRALGLRLLRWLGSEDALPELPPLPSVPAALELTDIQRLLLGLGTVSLSLLVLVTGLGIRWYRWRGR